MNKGYYRLMKLMLMFVIALALISAVSATCRTGTPFFFNVNVGDTSAPVITPLGCQPDPANISDNVTCIANVTDNVAIANITSNVTHTNGSVYLQNLSCSGSNVSQLCNFTFTQTTLAGLYNVTWFADDNSSNSATASDSFTVQNVTPVAPPAVGPTGPGGGGFGWDERFTSAKTIWDVYEEEPALPEIERLIAHRPRIARITEIALEVPEKPEKEYKVAGRILYADLIFTVASLILLGIIIIYIIYTEIRMRGIRKKQAGQDKK